MSVVKFAVEAGQHDRKLCPVSVELGEEAKHARLVDPRKPKKKLFCQPEGNKLWFILPKLKKNKAQELELNLDRGCPCKGKGVTATETGGKTLDISISGKPFVTYHFGSEVIRPFFHPVVGPWGLEMTRAWPIVEGVSGEDQDHIHHKSLWVAHGLVNGANHWSDNEPYGKQVHESFESITSGCVFGGFIERLRWITSEGVKQLEEKRTVRIWNTPHSLRILDLGVEFTASEGDVLFGDTKEGGLCSLRIAEAIKGQRGGRIENAYGAVGESECWGKHSPWVDYSGRLEGKHAGAAIMGHPMNPRHPTCWHVRGYGLFSANPFAYSYYKSMYEQNGDWTLKAGETAAFRYRIAFHQGDARKGKVADQFNDWINPPSAQQQSDA